MSNIFELAAQFKRLEEELIESGGELTSYMETELSLNRQQLEEKAADFLTIIRKLNAEEKMAKDEIERLTRIASVRKNAAERLEKWFKGAMQTFGIKKIEWPTGSVTLVEKDGIEYVDETKIPKEFVEEVTVKKIDKRAIQEAVKSGRTVEGTEKKTVSYLLKK